MQKSLTFSVNYPSKNALAMNHWIKILYIISLILLLNSQAASKEVSNNIFNAEQLSVGKVDFALSCQPKTTTLFNKATALLHSFEYDQARQIFNSLTQQDPECAMSYWGIAMTYLKPLWAPPTASDFYLASQAITTANNLIKKSYTQKNNTTHNFILSKEKKYIHAIKQYFNGQLSEKQVLITTPNTCQGSPIGSTPHREKILAYRDAMSAMYQEYPKDIEVALFYALAVIGTADPQDIEFKNQFKAANIMQPFIKSNPNHPGLAHYIIHSFDTPELAERALEAAYRYAKIAPDSAHARHMPSHIFQRLGMWENSINSNLDAAESARNFAKRTNIQGHWDEELHALDFLTNAYMQLGKYKEAKANRDYIYSMKEFYPENFKIAYVLSATPARYALERKDWQAAATLPLSHKFFPWKNFPWERGILHFAKGYAKARLGYIQGAKAEIHQLNLLKNQLIASRNKALALRVDIQILKIEAWIALANKKPTIALTTMKKAAKMEWETVIPTGAILPAYEMLGEMHHQLGEYKKAIIMFEKTLTKETNRRNSLDGIKRAAKKLGDNKKMQKYSLLLEELTEKI